mgnify:CR=1 FL=1
MVLRNSVQALLIAAALGVAPVAAATDASDISQLVKARYVHCAFYKSYETDPATGGPIMVEGRGNALMYFQRIDIEHETADAISTRMSGLRSVTVKKTAKAIHFIDNVDGMYVMTSVHSCLNYDEKRGACMTYGAVNSRVFDSSVLADPDKVYDKIKDVADPGFCDHSFIGIQEASHDGR